MYYAKVGALVAVVRLLLAAAQSQQEHTATNAIKGMFRDKMYQSSRSALKLALKIPAHCPKRSDPEEQIGKTGLMMYSPTTLEDHYIELKPNDAAKCAQELVQKGFDLSAPSILYSAGWRQRGDITWLRKIRMRHSMMSDSSSSTSADDQQQVLGRRHNLIFFDFEDTRLSYGSAARKVPKLGKLLADLFMELTRQYGYPAAQVHLIGFSLSAHIVGLAGRHLRAMHNPIRRITVLDPAGPCFFGDSEFARENTIGVDAAELVVARHYGFGLLGAKRGVGGVDIYVNGGFKQPAELKKGRNPWLVRKLAGSHGASAFHEAFSGADKDCHNVAYKCTSYRSFMEGACADCGGPQNSGCFYMDTLGSSSSIGHSFPFGQYPHNVSMYVNAGGDTFCLYHYQVLVQLAPSASFKTIESFENGQVTLDLGLSSDEVAPRRLTSCYGSRAYTVLATSRNRLQVKSAILFNKSARQSISPSEVQMIRLNYMSHLEREQRLARSTTLCPNGPHLFSVTTCGREQIERTCY